jgi:serine/threonine protein kinase
MNTEPMPRCPQCGELLPPDAPDGLCPNCLMALNLKTETVFTDDATAAQPPLPPEQIAPHFPQLEILECLGRGGMGVVYKARQKSLNRFVALKLLAPERVQDAKFAERFTREAQALAALNHPNIVTIYDFGQAGGFYYLLMEYVDGLNLRQLLRTRKFTPEEALAIVPVLCDALQFAHDRGIVHRDIKPENLLLDKTGKVKVADFGIAKMLGMAKDGRVGATAAPETVTQSAVGTPSYSAPEQKTDPQRVDSRADIYSLGVVFYELLTGELPGKPIAPPSSKVQIDVRLDEIVLRALEKKPELRYQQASELKTQVETIVASPPKPSSPEEEKSKLMNKKTIAAIAVIALLLTAVGYASWPTIIKSDQKGSAQTNPENQATVTATNESNYRLTIELRDGSHVVGKSLEDTLRFHSASLGDMKLAVAGIRSIAMADDGVTARLEATNGDALDVQFITQILKVETGFGKTELPVKLIKNVRVAAVGKLPPALPGLVAWWSAEGNANDVIGGNNGTVYNGVGYAAGEVGHAFSFNGTNSYVQVPDAPALRLTNELTIEFWVKRQQLTEDYIVNKGGDWTGGALNYGVSIAGPANGNILHFLYANGIRGTISITDFNWHHCAVTARNGDADPTFYVDGVQQPILLREGSATMNLYPSTAPLYIGAQLAAVANYFSGAEIDELGIYNRALSADEIQTIYNLGNPIISIPPPANPPKPNIPTTVTNTNETGFRLTIDLRDGSHVVGKSLEDTLRLHSASLGDMKLAVSGIRSIVMADDGVTAKVTTTSGDSLDVQFVTPALHVETGFGKTELPVKLIRSVKISAISQQPSSLIDVDFGSGGARGYSLKIGIAAIGQSDNDFWNFYDRDTSPTPNSWRQSGELANLKLADGEETTVGMSVSDAPGAWGNDSSDPMYKTYDYPLDGGNNVVTFNNLPAGQYDVLAYSPDGNYEVTVGGTSYGIKTTQDSPVSNMPVWAEGVQYARFREVTVAEGQSLVLTVRKGVGNYAILSGVQILSDSEIQGNNEAGKPNTSATPVLPSAGKTNVQTTIASTNETGFRLTIELRDGSRVSGKNLEDTLHFHSASLGDMKLAVSGIRSIVMADDGVTAKVTTTSGDSLDVQFVTPALHVETGFGKTELPVKLIRSVKISAATNPGQLPPGLVSLWSGEGNGRDSIAGNDGILMPGVNFETGVVGQAFHFNGNDNSYVKIPDSPSLDSLAASITIVAWIKVNQFNPFPDWNGIVTKGNSSWRLSRYGGTSAIGFSTTGLSDVDLPGNKNINDGQWHHVAAVYDGKNKYIYVDGALDASVPATGSIAQNNFPVGIGENAEALGHLWNGSIDEVAIYNRALTADEIQTIYNAVKPGNTTP